MNKTEYINTLKEELQGLASKDIDDIVNEYNGKFEDGIQIGLSELEISENLPKPRLVAAQKKAQLQYKKFKSNMTPRNFGSMLFAFIGVMIFNLLMVVPFAMYGFSLVSGYVASIVLYGAGIILIAASISGVPEMKVSVPFNYSHHQNWHEEFESATVEINETKIIVNANEKQVKENSSQKKQDKGKKEIIIKNKVTSNYGALGLGILLSGIALMILVLWMFRMTFVWFKQYLLWNLSLLRSS